MNGNLKLAKHLGVRNVANNIFGYKLIFKTIINKVFGIYTIFDEGAYLVYHSLLKAGLQTTCYLLTAQVAIDVDANDKRIDWRKLALWSRMLEVIGFYLYGTYGALHRIHICMVVHIGAILAL